MMKKKDADTDDWIFRLRPLPGQVPAVNRIRRALKALLRVYGLRCVAVLASDPRTPPLLPEEDRPQKP